MKKYVVLFMILCFCSCKYKAKLYEDNSGSGAFTSELKNEMEAFITYTDSIWQKKEKEMFYTLSMYNEDGKMVLLLGTSFFYQKKRINGYAFVNDRLFVYYGNSSGKEQKLVNVTKLIQFVDTIPGYRSDICIDMDYEVVKREYIILDNDSLSLIYSGFY